jgi:hypothetical protein
VDMMFEYHWLEIFVSIEQEADHNIDVYQNKLGINFLRNLFIGISFYKLMDVLWGADEILTIKRFPKSEFI